MLKAKKKIIWSDFNIQAWFLKDSATYLFFLNKLTFLIRHYTNFNFSIHYMQSNFSRIKAFLHSTLFVNDCQTSFGVMSLCTSEPFIHIVTKGLFLDFYFLCKESTAIKINNKLEKSILPISQKRTLITILVRHRNEAGDGDSETGHWRIFFKSVMDTWTSTLKGNKAPLP